MHDPAHQSPAALVVSVVPQGKGSEIICAAKEANGLGGFIMFGQGTATQEIWDRLGITKYREVVLCTTLYSKVEACMKAISTRMDVIKEGGGIVFAVSIDRFLGRKLIRHMMHSANEYVGNIEDLDKDKVNEMKQKVEKMVQKQSEEKEKAQQECDKELIVIRMSSGYGQEVMDCARKAGAVGGTILRGRTSLDTQAIKFFNITIEPESDILFTLTPKSITDQVLDAVLQEWGPKSCAHAFGYVVPVLNVFGDQKSI